MSELTEQQAEFVVHFVSNGGNGTQAAISAGYAEASARSAAYKLSRLSHVQAAISAEQRRVLGGNLATKALKVLEAVLDNDATPFGVRVDACKAILDRGGLNPPKAMPAGNEDDDKSLAEMPLAQLEALAHRIRRQIEAPTAGADPKAAA